MTSTLYSGTNRLATRLVDIRDRCARLEPDALEKLDSDMALTFEEHFAYQQAQSRAAAMQRITTDEALLIYAALAEVGDPDNGGWASETDTATKVVVTLAMGELLTR